MGYIDADKLIKAIEDKGLDCSFALKMERLDTLALIDELQQEQPEVDLEKELEKWRHYYFKGKRDGDYNGEYLERESQLDLARHFVKLGRKQVLTAKPSEELEEEINRYFKELEKSDCVSNTRRLAKHFAEWGAEHARKEDAK